MKSDIALIPVVGLSDRLPPEAGVHVRPGMVGISLIPDGPTADEDREWPVVFLSPGRAVAYATDIVKAARVALETYEDAKEPGEAEH
jgi:hypothetical protein